MGLQARPVFRDSKQWAKDCLKRDKASVSYVMRVFPPLDTGSCVEVLFFDGFDRPCTALLDSTGVLVEYHVGW